MLLTDNTELQPSSPLTYSIQSTPAGLCVSCTFLDNSTNDCVAVVHQRISQLSSSGLMNIESSHKFIRSGDTASGCIEGVNLEQYQVGVIGQGIIKAATESKRLSLVQLIDNNLILSIDFTGRGCMTVCRIAVGVAVGTTKIKLHIHYISILQSRILSCLDNPFPACHFCSPAAYMHTPHFSIQWPTLMNQMSYN